MRITESQLRKVIRRMISEQAMDPAMGVPDPGDPTNMEDPAGMAPAAASTGPIDWENAPRVGSSWGTQKLGMGIEVFGGPDQFIAPDGSKPYASMVRTPDSFSTAKQFAKQVPYFKKTFSKIVRGQKKRFIQAYYMLDEVLPPEKGSTDFGTKSRAVYQPVDANGRDATGRGAPTVDIVFY